LSFAKSNFDEIGDYAFGGTKNCFTKMLINNFSAANAIASAPRLGHHIFDG
jgi:hypothetical protein